MEDKYIKFYQTFDKRFRNNKKLIHCINSVSNGGMSLNRELNLEKISGKRTNVFFKNLIIVFSI